MQANTSELHSAALILVASLGEASFGRTSFVILTSESLEKESPSHETSKPAFNRAETISSRSSLCPRREQKGAAAPLPVSNAQC